MNHDVSNSFSNLQIPQRHLHLAPFPPPSTLENHLVCEHHVCSLEFLALKKPRTLHSVKKVKYSSPIFWTLKRPHLGSAGSSTSFSTQRNRAHRVLVLDRAGPPFALSFCAVQHRLPSRVGGFPVDFLSSKPRANHGLLQFLCAVADVGSSDSSLRDGEASRRGGMQHCRKGRIRRNDRKKEDK